MKKKCVLSHVLNNKHSFFYTKTTRTFLFKIISLILIESLSFSSFVWAQQNETINAKSVSIPRELGLINERHCGDEDAFVIHIQDSHTNYSAQKYLSKIVDYLYRTYAVDVVGIEGASGVIDTSGFSIFPDKSVKRKVADYFLKEGKIDGSEYLCIVENQGKDKEIIKLYGMEDKTLYRSNLNAFLRSLPYQEELIYFCEVMDDNLEKIKKHIYGPHLLKYYKAVRDYRRSRIDFVSHCKQLIHFADQNLVEHETLENLERLFNLVELEATINFPRVESEHYIAVRRLSNQLPQDDSTELLKKEFQFKTKKISAEEYYFYLNALFQEHDFAIEKLPNLHKYIQCLVEFSNMDHNSVLQESELLEEKIFRDLLKNEDQKKLFEISKYIDLINNFSHLQMTRNFVTEYHRYRKKYDFGGIIQFVTQKAQLFNEPVTLDFDLSAIELNIENFEDFYNIAHLRERNMMENLIELMETKNEKSIVFVAGGFHTYGITEILKKKNISYIVVTPNTDNDQVTIPYTSLLKNIRTPFEQMLAVHTSTLKIASWLTQGTPLVYEERKAILSTKMKTLLTTAKLYDLYTDTLAQYSPEEQILIRPQIEQNLKSSINKIIQMANYQDVLTVESVEISLDDIIAQIKFANSHTPVFVRFTDRLGGDKLDAELEQNLLETVKLNDGITEEFLSSRGYVRVTRKYRTMRTKILETIFENPKKLKELLDELNSSEDILVITEDQLETYLQMFRNMGLVDYKQNHYFVSRSEPGRFFAFLTLTLFNGMAGEAKAQELGIVNVDTVPEKYRAIFDRLNTGTLIIEPDLPLEILKQIAEKMLAVDADKEIIPGAVISITNTVRMNVIKPVDSDRVILHVMTKPPQAARASKMRVNEIVRRNIQMETIGITPVSPLEDSFEKRVIEALDEIGKPYNGSITGLFLTPGEKSAMLDYLYRKVGITPDSGIELDFLYRYINLDRPTVPYFSKRIGTIILGDQFDLYFNRAFLFLTGLNPDIKLTSELENKITAALIALHSAHEQGTVGTQQWYELVSGVLDTIPVGRRKTTLPSAVSQTIKSARDMEADSGIPLTFDQFQQLVNSQVISMEMKISTDQKPLLASPKRRRTILDKAIAEQQMIRFRSPSSSVDIDLRIMQKNKDGTYLGVIEQTGDVYRIGLLTYQPQNNAFKYKDIKTDSENQFNDPAGFYLAKIDDAQIPTDSRSARLVTYAGLTEEWNHILDEVTIDATQIDLDSIAEAYDEGSLHMLADDYARLLTDLAQQHNQRLEELRVQVQTNAVNDDAIDTLRKEKAEIDTTIRIGFADIQAMEQNINQLIDSSPTGLESDEINKQIDTIRARIKTLRQTVTDMIPQRFDVENKIKEYASQITGSRAERAQVIAQIDAVESLQHYHALLLSSITVLCQALDDGEQTILVDEKSIPFSRASISTIIYGLAHSMALEKRADAENNLSDTLQSQRAFELADAVYKRSFVNHFSSSILDERVPFEQMSQPGIPEFLLYGVDTDNEFSHFQDKTDNYAMSTLMNNALDMVVSADPCIAAWLQNEARIVVTRNLFLPRTRKGLENLIGSAVLNNTVFIEKAVFGRIIELMDENPRVAAKLMASAIISFAQGVVASHSGIINLNTASKIRISKVLLEQLRKNEPELLENKEIAERIGVFLRQSAAKIVAARRTGKVFTSSTDLTDVVDPFVSQLLLPYIRFDDSTPYEAYTQGLKKATRLLGSNFKNVHTMLRLERSILLDGVADEKIEKPIDIREEQFLVSGFKNNDIAVTDQYRLFFERLFGTDIIYSQIISMINEFNRDSSGEVYLDYTNQLQQVLERMTDVTHYRFEAQLNLAGQTEFLVTLPNGEQTVLSSKTKTVLEKRLAEFKDDLHVYYLPGRGIGFSFKYQDSNTRKLPMFLNDRDTTQVTNGILEQARIRDLSEVTLQTDLKPFVAAAIDILDKESGGNDLETVKTELLQHDTAVKLREDFKYMIAQIKNEWNEMTPSEKKGLAALIIVQHQLPLRWVEFISGIYRESVPLVVSNRVNQAFSQLTKNDFRYNFADARSELLDLVAHEQWDTLSPSSRHAVFQTVIESHKLSVENTVTIRGTKPIDEVSALLNIFRRVDKQAANAEPSYLTAQAIAVMWDNEKRTLSESVDPDHVRNTLNVYLDLIHKAHNNLLKDQHDGWQESQREDFKFLAFMERNLREGIVVNVIQAVEDFNKKYRGILKIDTNRDFISAQPDKVLDFILDFSREFTIDESLDQATVLRKQIMDDYMQARQMWNTGQHEKAAALLETVAERIGETQLFTTPSLLTYVADDVELLRAIIGGEAQQYELQDLFRGFDSVFSETLARLPQKLYIPARLGMLSYLINGIQPEEGITDVVIHFTAEIDKSKFTDGDVVKSFYDYGVLSEEHDIFVDLGKLGLNKEKDWSFLSEAFIMADRARDASLLQNIGRLDSFGLPSDARLLKFSKKSLQPYSPDMKLDDGFSIQNIDLLGDDFGMKFPLALHPLQYKEIIDREIEQFETFRKIVAEASQLITEDNNYEAAKTLLIQAQFIVVNLRYFSPQLRADILKVLDQDVKDMDSELTADTSAGYVPAVLLHGISKPGFIEKEDVTGNPVIKKLVQMALDEIGAVDPQLQTKIQSNMTIVVGKRPREQIPYNVIYINPIKFQYLEYLAQKETTLPIAATVLANHISDLLNNSRQLLSKIITDNFLRHEKERNRFIHHTQIPVADVSPNFTGEVVNPLTMRYDDTGHPFADMNGPRTITTFRNGRPIKVWNSVTGKEYILPLPFEKSDFGAYRVEKNETGYPVLVETLSELEQWIGQINIGDDVYFLAKNNKVIAVVKESPQTAAIIPLINDAQLAEILEVADSGQAIRLLDSIVEQRRQRVKQETIDETLFPEGDMPSLDMYPRKRRFINTLAGGAVIAIPMVLLIASGCAAVRSVPTSPFTNPYDRADLFLRPALSSTDMDTPHDLVPFIGTTGDQTTDQQAVIGFTEGTIAILRNILDGLNEELALLNSQPILDQSRIQTVEARIERITSTIDNLEMGMNLPETVRPDWLDNITDMFSTEHQVTQQTPTGIHTAVPLPEGFSQVMDQILADEQYRQILEDLSRFGHGQFIQDGDFGGMVRSYALDKDHPDYQYLAEYGRVVPYDVSISIFADLSRNNNTLARQKVMALLGLMQSERDHGFEGVIHFGYNTVDDSYVDFRAPLGNTAWTLKAIYSYITITGDRSILEGNNEQLLQSAMDFVLSQQVMDQTDPRYGLFRAGLYSVQTDGYGVMGSEHNQYEMVVTEHIADVHDLLNLAYQVTGNELYRQRRELLDRSSLNRLLIEDENTAHFAPNLDRSGEHGTGVAIDDLTWAGSMVLTMDHLPQERRLEIVRKMVRYIDENFIVEHNPDSDRARPVELNQALIDARTREPGNTIIGVKFFDGVYGDEFIEPRSWDDPQVMSVHVEGTLGYMHLLYQLLYQTTDSDERQFLTSKMRFLLDNMNRLYTGQSNYGGIPYSTRNIPDIQTTLESLIASETYSTVLGIWQNPALMWSFIGVPEQTVLSRQSVVTPMGQFRPQGGELVQVSPNKTYVFVADPTLHSHIIYPSNRIGIQLAQEQPLPTLQRQISEDFDFVMGHIISFMAEHQDFSPETVQQWEGEFVRLPQWTVESDDLFGLERLAQNTDYQAYFANGQLVIQMEHSISLALLQGLEVGQIGDEFSVTIQGNKIVIQPTLSAQEAEKYSSYPEEVRRLFFDTRTAPLVFNLSDFPELGDYPQGVAFRARVGDDLQHLLVAEVQPTVSINAGRVFGTEFYAPNNTEFTVRIDKSGSMQVRENVDIASVFQNPWTPNIVPEMLPQFMAGLKKTGHTQLFVSTIPLIVGRDIHGLDSRVYYNTLIELAHREGIEVYAFQGGPDWILPAGLSSAQLYLRTLGNVAVNFDGYVLNIQAQKLPDWRSADEQQQQELLNRYMHAITEFEEIISSFSGHQIPIFSYVPNELRAIPGYTSNRYTDDILMVDSTTPEDIMKAVEEAHPTREFHILIETSLITDTDATFGLREDEMGAVLQDIAQQLRANPQFGRYFRGFVINHDTGEDILQVMQYGTGRQLQERFVDGIATSADKALMITQNVYEMIISGQPGQVIQAGEERPDLGDIVIGTLLSRLEGVLRGITGAANVDHMINSVVETIRRDRLTILPEAIPLGAEVGTSVAGASLLWGQQYTDMAALTSVTIQGLDEYGAVVIEWQDLVNNPTPIIVGRGSRITELKVSVTVESGATQHGVFPGYIVFLTHHPNNGGVVTETSSDEFMLEPNSSSTVDFTVPVSREGVNNYGFMLMHGRKYTSSEVVVDRIGFGHRYRVIAEWLQKNVNGFVDYYTDSVDAQNEINRLGLWSGVIDTRVIVSDCTIDQLNSTTPEGIKLIDLLTRSGITEFTISGDQLMEVIQSSRDQDLTKRQVIDFISALQHRNIRVTLLMGDESWVDDEDAMQENLLPIFRLHLGFNGFVFNFGDKTSQVNIETYRTYIGDNAGYREIAVVEDDRLVNTDTAETLLANLDIALATGQETLYIPVQNFTQLVDILDLLPEPEPEELVVRAEQVDGEELEQYVVSGFSRLSRVEQLLMDFAKLKLLPPIQLGESSVFVDLLSTQNIFVSEGDIPYITFEVTYDGDRSIGTFTANVELTNLYTGERIQDAFPINLSTDPDTRTQIINIPVVQLTSGQWRYDVSIVPSYYERDIASVPAMPMTDRGSTVRVGQWDVDIFPQDTDTFERRVVIAGNEFFLVDRPDEYPAVRVNGEIILLPENLQQGIHFELGPAQIRVNVSKNRFNEWAIETTGEEVVITQFKNLEEVLTIGIPHRSRVYGYIQHGLPDIQVNDVALSIPDPFIPDLQTEIINIQFGQQFQVGDYNMTLEIQREGIIQATIIAPDGQITRRGFSSSSTQRVFVLGDRILLIGQNSLNQPVGVVSPYTMANVSFEVSNEPSATSSLVYTSEVSFYHPLVGEVSIPSEEDYSIDIGETRSVTMLVPIPVDFLGRQKLQLSRIAYELQDVQFSYTDFLRDKARDRELGIQSGTVIDQQIQQRYQQVIALLPGYITDAQALIRQVQEQNLISEFHLTGIVDLNARYQSLSMLSDRIEGITLETFPYILNDIATELHLLRIAFADLSTQNSGYRISINDVSNLLGEEVYARVIPMTGEISSQARVPIVRDIVVEPVTGKTDAQVVRRIGKSQYVQVVVGVVTPSVIQETHDGFVAQQRFLTQSRAQFVDLMRDMYRVEQYNIVSSQLAVDQAQTNIELATSARDRSRTVDLTAMFFGNINSLKTADIRGGQAHILRYAETVFEGERLIYDTSTEILAVLLLQLQDEDSRAVRSDVSRFLNDLVGLFGLLNADELTADEAIVYVNAFLVGVDEQQRQRAEGIIRTAMDDDRLSSRQRAAFIVSHIVTEPQVREYIRDLAFAGMTYQLDREEQEITSETGLQRDRELARIRSLRAYMGLVLEHDVAEQLLEEAANNLEQGIDPILQAAGARVAFQRALGYFQIVIGLEDEFQPVIDLNELLTKIEQSDLPAQDKTHAYGVIEQIRNKMQDFDQFLADRSQALIGAEQSLADQQDGVLDAGTLLQQIQGNKAGHQLFVERLEQEREEQFLRWKIAVRSAPHGQAITYIQQVLEVETEILAGYVEDLEQANISKEYYIGVQEENAQLREDLYRQQEQSVSEVERQIIIASQIRILERESLRATAELSFLEWYIPFLEDQIGSITVEITQLQGAVMALGGTESSELTQQLIATNQRLQSRQQIEDDLSATMSQLTGYRDQLEDQYESLLAEYNYPERMRTVGESIQLSTILNDVSLIRNPESYFKVLQNNGISEVYISQAEVANEDGSINLDRLRNLGRIIQAAQSNNMTVKFLITGQYDWTRGRFLWFGLADRPGTRTVGEVAETFRLFQQRLFEFGVYIDGFAIELTPYRTGEGDQARFDMGSYRGARNEIARAIEGEGEKLLSALREAIEQERESAHFERAEQMEQMLQRMLGTSEQLMYEFDVFETEQTAHLIDQDLQDRFGDEASDRRLSEYRGRSIIRSSSVDISHIKTLDSGLVSTPHGIAIDWSSEVAQGNEEQLPSLLEDILAYSHTENQGVVSIFIDSESVLALQRSLNALGAVPLDALDLLQTQADLETVYHERVREYVGGLRGQLTNLREVLDAERAFRESTSGLLGQLRSLPQYGLVIEMPEYLLSSDLQLEQLDQRLEELQQRAGLGVDMAEAEELSNQIDQLYEDISINVRRLRLGLSALFSSDGFQIPGIMDSDPLGIISGNSSVSFDFGQLLGADTPIGLSISYTTADGKQEQRDLLREHEILRTSIEQMREAAILFSEFADRVNGLELQLQEDYADVARLRQGIDIASRSNAQIQPEQFVIDGEEITISGNVITGLRDINRLINEFEPRVEAADRETRALENASSTLAAIIANAGTPDRNNNFITQYIESDMSVRSIDYAIENRELAEDAYRQAERGRIVAQREFERVAAGLQGVHENVLTAASNIDSEQIAIERSRENLEQAFIDMLTALSGTQISRDQLYDIQVGQVGATLQLQAAEGDLRQAYFNFDTVFHRIVRLIRSQGAEAQFDAYFSTYETGGVLPGWGLDAALGSGTPYISIDRSDAGVTIGQIASELLQPPVSISLYGGFIKMSASYTNPNVIGLSLNFSPAEASVIGQADQNLLMRQSQYILTQIVSEERREGVESAVEHFEYMLNNYQEHVQMLEWHQRAFEQASEQLETGVANLEQARHFLHQNEREVQLAQYNLEKRYLNLLAAHQTVEEIEETAQDLITPDEARGEMLYQQQPDVVEEDINTTITTKAPYMGDVHERSLLVNKFFARIIYAVLAYFLIVFEVDFIRSSLRKRALRKAKKLAQPKDKKGKLRYGLTGVLFNILKRWGQGVSSVVKDDLKAKSKSVDTDSSYTPPSDSVSKSVDVDTGISEITAQPLLIHKTILPLYKGEGAYFHDHNHVNRVTELVGLIGSRLGISEQEMEVLVQATLIHDLGKIGLDGTVLREARTIIARQSDNVFIPLADILNILNSEREKEIAELKSQELDPEDEATAIDSIHQRYQRYVHAYHTLFNNHEMVGRVLEEKIGVVLDDDSPIMQIAAQHSRSEMTLENSRTRLLAGILTAANIIDSTQALERQEYYNRNDGSFDDAKLGLFPNIERSLDQGRIGRDVYRAVVDLILVEENQDILRLIAASRKGAFNSDQVSKSDIAKLTAEIDDYFRQIQKALVSSSLSGTEQKDKQTSVTTPATQEEQEADGYSQEKIDSIFEQFSINNPLPMIEFLQYFEANPALLPSPLSIYKNGFFNPLRQNGQSPREVFEQLSQIGRKIGLPLFQITQLQTILERTHYVQAVTEDRDVIVLDLDTIGLSPIENSANEQYRKLLLEYIDALFDQYDAHGRQPKLVLFSKKLQSWEVSTMVGEALIRRFDQIYGKELFDSFASAENEQFFSFLTTLSTYYDINRINVKIFSNHSTVMDAAQKVGAILADREGTIFDALAVFANLHPYKSADLLIKGAGVSLRELIQVKNRGYYSLAGEECCVKKIQKKFKNVYTQYLLDTAV